MGNGHTTDSMVNRSLKRQAKKAQKKIKMVLLGAGDSGKTTVFKQLLNSKGTGFDDNTLRHQAKGLIMNIIEGTHTLIKGANEVGEKLKGYENEVNIFKDVFESLIGQIDVEVSLTEEIVAATKKLWKNEAIQQVYPICIQSGKYNISDNFQLLIEKLDNFPEWGGSNWTPSIEDCMLLRSPTTGMQQQLFNANTNTFELIDVGGQRSERRKWYHLFEGVNAVIYVCSMSEYDQTLFEADDVNRLEESRRLFKSVAESNHFRDSAFIIFFNKLDIFIEKYSSGIPINFSGLFDNAPLYENDPDYEKAKEWYRDLLLSSLNEFAKHKTYSFHYTTALDTAQMNEVINDCTAHLLRAKILQVGLARETD